MSGKARQFYTAIASGFGSLLAGALNVWPSYTTPLFKSNETSPLSSPITQVEESLLGSLPSLGAMLGVAIAGNLFNVFGRKNGGIIISLPFVVSWTIIRFSRSVNLVLAARFLSGIASGGYIILAPIFVSEVSEDSFRGALASVSMFFYCLGTSVSYIMGWLFTYQTIIWLQVVLSVISIALIMCVVESPVYYLKKNRIEDARASFAKYRGVPETSLVVAEELSKLKHYKTASTDLISVTDLVPKVLEGEKEKLNNKIEEGKDSQSISSIKLLFTSPVSRRAFCIVTAVISFQVLMGIVPVQVYAKTVFEETDPANADTYTVMFATTLFLGCVVSTFITDKAGRRILLISSSILVCACLTSLGFLIGNKAYPVWISVLLILMYCFFFMSGAGSVPYVLLAELFTPEVQNIASILIIEWVWFLNFFIIGVFPYMLNLFGIQGAFFVFACVSIINAIFGYVMVPETKGLSKTQIQSLLDIKNNSNKRKYFYNSIL